MILPRKALSAEISKAFIEYDRKATFSNFRAACYIGILLMPVGSILDYFVYNDRLSLFLLLRLLCSVLIGVFWKLVDTPSGQAYQRELGVILAMFPTVCISGMILIEQGSDSPYYAGLSLVLLVIGFVLNWRFAESFVAVSLVLTIYLAACLLHGPPRGATTVFTNTLFSNLYFLVLTGIIVVTGSYYHSKLRFREFELRYELDHNQQQLKQTNEKLIELDQIKSRFFANISHELRTPLTLLLAPLETLRKRFGRSMDEDTGRLLATMQSNGMRLLKLINDLLDLVRLESGRMEVKPEPVEVAQFIGGMASATRHVAEDKRIRLETWTDPGLDTVAADRDKLEKVVLNLIFNALKFTPAGGCVQVRAEQVQEQLLLTVRDTGMGIPEKNLPFIFDRFWQADGSSKRKYQGVGIGLALVKELVELQGGKVTVQSQEGAGTTFEVRIPYVKAERPAAPAARGSGDEDFMDETGSCAQTEEWLTNLYRRAELFPAITSVQEALRPVETWSSRDCPRILVADDEPDMLRFLKSQLIGHYQVLEAVDGQQAVEKAAQFLPDLILLDMMMPEKDGLQACRELRERTPTQSIPIILLTARADEDTKMAALEVGASDFLPKPFSTTELHVRIKNLVESYQYQRHLARQNQVLERTIEQLKETELQLVQTEKMASLGRLSAGIIHEINNPLNYATMGLFTLRSKGRLLAQDAQAEYSDILNDVEEGLKRVKEIVGELRTFSYADNAAAEEVDVADVLRAALRFLSHEWKDQVEIQQRIAKGMSVLANKNKLIQVLVNLIQNSLDALKQREYPSDGPRIWIEGRTEGARSVLMIRDNGNGIDPKHLDKVFDPFFTTKDVGEGLGLGLSICYRIVQEWGGRISIRSEPGQFCEVTIHFPITSVVGEAASA
jgi:signal transduction histidine kinase